MADMKPCTTMFSNGSEYEFFIQTNCERNCTRLRKGRCAILRRIEMARFEDKYFPYNELLDYADGYAGKVCKKYTTEKKSRKHTPKPMEGQVVMEEIYNG